MLLDISIHALREEGDALLQTGANMSAIFLSTPSARRATIALPLLIYSPAISIHALREEGDPRPPAHQGERGISIHALREEGDLDGGSDNAQDLISIHALREEGDQATKA